jgi:hypothetical protein
MNLLPKGTVDPSAFLYDNGLYTISGIIAFGAVCNMFIKPIDKSITEEYKLELELN